MSIISKEWLYWLEFFNTLNNFLIFSLVVSLGILIFLFIYKIIEMNDSEFINNCIIASFIILIVSVFGLLFTPSQKTVYKMMLSDVVTKHNIELGEDYIDKQMDKINDIVEELYD